MAAAGNEFGRHETVQEDEEGEQCLVLCDWIIRNVGTGHNNMMVAYFSGIRMEQLHRVSETGI